MLNFFKKSRPTLQDALKPPPIEGKPIGDFTGFMRVLLFENGILFDGKYDVDQLAHALAKLMIEDPQILETVEKAVMIRKIESNPVLSAFASLARELMTDDEGNCQCPRCAAKREEKKVKNN